MIQDFETKKMLIAEMIRNRMAELKMKKKDLAVRLNTKPSVVTKLCRGTNYQIKTLFQLERILNIKILDLS